MNYLKNLWKKPKFRRDDPETSKTAGRKASKFVSGHYRHILNALEGFNLTAKEIGEETGLTSVQIARRIPELRSAGFVDGVLEDGEILKREGCQVWRLVKTINYWSEEP